MHFVINRGQRVAYDVAGGGDNTVVLLAGLGTRRTDWADAGYVAGFADEFRVVSIDSLGHGDSDSPADCSLYTPRQRVGDVIAVLDQEWCPGQIWFIRGQDDWSLKDLS